MILFDECLPWYLPEFLNRASGEERAISIRDVSPGAKDWEWLEVAGNNGWHAITLDRFGGNRDSIERVAARKFGVRVVLVPRRIIRLGAWEMQVTIIRAWPTLEQSISNSTPGTRFELRQSGQVKRLKD